MPEPNVDMECHSSKQDLEAFKDLHKFGVPGAMLLDCLSGDAALRVEVIRTGF